MARLKAIDNLGQGQEEPDLGLSMRRPEQPLNPTPRVELPTPGLGPVGGVGRGEETPRDRNVSPNMGGNVAPKRPNQPQPMAGSTFQPEQGIVPFQPMGSPSLGSMATPHSSGLYGGAGGLTGGGLGVPLDPTPDAASDPISTLIAMLMRGQ